MHWHRHHDTHSTQDTIVDLAAPALLFFGIGAGLMFLMDPRQGGRRRSLVRGKMTRAWHETETGMRKTAQYSGARFKGMLAEARASLRHEEVPDPKLAARVRSAIGRACSHPSAVQVFAADGMVTLRGDVLRDEEAPLLSAVEGVRGVSEVRNEMRVYQRGGTIPQLQGGSRRTGGRIDYLQCRWNPLSRLTACLAGGLLTAAGVWRRDAIGLVAAVCGLGLIGRGMANLPMKRLVGVGAGRRAVDVQKTITIHAPIDRVFGFFANYANFPHFMTNVHEVRDHANTGRSHWVVAGPAGIEFEWDADLTEYVPNEIIAWKSVEGSTVENAGYLRFEEMPDGATRVTVRLSYNPPGGALGHLVGKVFGADPKSEMNQDLLRVKTMIETGHPAHDAAQPLRGSADGAPAMAATQSRIVPQANLM